MMEDFQFLGKPDIDYSKLTYISCKKNIYANLFELHLKKEIKIYQYPFTINPPLELLKANLKDVILNKSYKEIKEIYGTFIISGDSIYSIVKRELPSSCKSAFYTKG